LACFGDASASGSATSTPSASAIDRYRSAVLGATRRSTRRIRIRSGGKSRSMYASATAVASDPFESTSSGTAIPLSTVSRVAATSAVEGGFGPTVSRPASAASG
jgi:hypothetical protein